VKVIKIKDFSLNNLILSKFLSEAKEAINFIDAVSKPNLAIKTKTLRTTIARTYSPRPLAPKKYAITKVSKNPKKK